MQSVQQEHVVQGHTSVSLHTHLDVTRLEALVASLLESFKTVEEQLRAQQTESSVRGGTLDVIARAQDTFAASMSSLQNAVASLATAVSGLKSDLGDVKHTLNKLNSESRNSQSPAQSFFEDRSLSGTASRGGSGESNPRTAAEADHSGMHSAGNTGHADKRPSADREDTGRDAGQGGNVVHWPSVRVAAGLGVAVLIAASLYLAYGAFANF